MATDNVVVLFERLEALKHEPLETGGGPPYDGDMEARVAKLEAHVEHIQSDIGEIKSDLRDVRTVLSAVKESIASAKVWALGLYIALAAALLGAMATGFGWLYSVLG